MQIKPEHLEQLEKEVQHIFDSGANEVRVYNMVQTFIEKRGEALFLPIVSINKACKCDIPDPFKLMPYKCFRCHGKIEISEVAVCTHKLGEEYIQMGGERTLAECELCGVVVQTEC